MPEPEILRLKDLMPASCRMSIKLVDQPNQPQVIEAQIAPLKFNLSLININFVLWEKLPQSQRDMML